MPRGRRQGFRLPCRQCGATRTNEPRNGLNVAICRRCYPAWVKGKNDRQHVGLYLGPVLKAQVRARAKALDLSIQDYIRQVLRAELGR